MQQPAARSVNIGLVVRNWLFGWYIVEYQQNGADRAEYGEQATAIAMQVQAKIALAANDPESALIVLDELADRGMPKGGFFWIDSLALRADAHRRAGRPTEAVMVHEEILNIWGGHALSHFALAGLYEELGRPEDAVAEYETFLEMWAEADEGLPQLVEVKSRLTAFQTRQ